MNRTRGETKIAGIHTHCYMQMVKRDPLEFRRILRLTMTDEMFPFFIVLEKKEMLNCILLCLA
jgi:hypothetical protein